MGAGGRRAAAFKRSQTAGDPYFSFVKFLYLFDGTDESTTFTDVKGHTVSSKYGTPILSATDKYFGATALQLDGTDAFDISGGTDEDFGSADFCIEVISRITIQQTDKFLLGARTPGGSGSDGFILGLGGGGAGGNAGTLRWQGGGVDTTGTTRIDDNVWRYNVISKSGGFVRAYTGVMGQATAAREINTAIAGTITNSSTVRPRVGANDYTASASTGFLTGYIDSMRISYGTDRGFTGATIPIPTTRFQG